MTGDSSMVTPSQPSLTWRLITEGSLSVTLSADD
jgi:hypothetical protein